MFFIIKSKSKFIEFTKILNIVSIFLVLYSVFNITYYEYNFRKSSIKQDLNGDPDTLITYKEIKKEDFPDIYYIIFDRYGSTKMLKQYFIFDNSKFDNYLKKKGFYIAADSMANYPYTYLSLASSLNCQYMNFLNKTTGKSIDKTIVYDYIKNSKVVNFLKSKDYKYYHLGSWWEPTRTNRYADMNFISKKFKVFNIYLDEFTSMVFQTTLFSRIIELFSGKNFSEVNILRGSQGILNKFKYLKKMPELPGPKFVFSHFLVTHSPYHFDKNGGVIPKKISKSKISQGQEKELYLESILFTNNKIKEFVNEIITKSKKTPVIIIQADEGPKSRALKPKENWKNNLDLRRNIDIMIMRSSIINAILIPEKYKKYLYPKISPVNTFRVIFNCFFGTKLKILKDRTYISKNPKNLYSFIDISEKLRGRRKIKVKNL